MGVTSESSSDIPTNQYLKKNGARNHEGIELRRGSCLDWAHRWFLRGGGQVLKDLSWEEVVKVVKGKKEDHVWRDRRASASFEGLKGGRK